MEDLNNVRPQICENCSRTTKVRFPVYWETQNEHYSLLCPRCLWEWTKIGKFDEDFVSKISSRKD